MRKKRKHTKPLPYQLEAYHMINQLGGRALIADEMGLGKTFESLYWCRRRKIKPVLVICPASLKLNWEREARVHFGVHSQVLSGRKPPRGWKAEADIVIINYDILSGWKPRLRKAGFQCVIIDECHKIKTRTTARARITRSLARKSKYALALSGTPIEARPIELWTAIDIVMHGRRRIGELQNFATFGSFAQRYCRPERMPWGWRYTGASKVKELGRLLRRHVLIRRRKADVLKDLPPKSRHVHVLECDLSEYQEVEQDFLYWLETKDRSKARRAARAERLVQIGYLRRMAGRAKVEQFIEWAEDFLEQTGQKLVIMACHHFVIQRLREHFGNRAVTLTGRTPEKRRQENVDRFQNVDACRVFIGNLKAAGVGHTLTAASTLCFVEFSWLPGEHLQAEDRIHRIGQTNPAQIIYFVAANTYEEYLCELLRKRQRILEETMDGQGNGESLDMLVDVVKQFKRKAPSILSHSPTP